METISKPVDSPVILQDLCDQIQGASRLAVDTEFTRIRTYRPQLELVQIATENLIFCVDARFCPDLSSLVEVLEAPETTVVLHAADQDLEVLNLYGVFPKRLYDTQIAARLCGYEKSSYQFLVQQIFDVTLSKSMTKSRWNKRPFSPGQIRYALNDVRYLLEIRDTLSRSLERLNRTKWLQEECQRILQLYRGEIKPETAWKSFHQGGGLSVVDQHIARELLVWRERRAQKINWPRQWVISDQNIIEVVRSKPRTTVQIAAMLNVRDSSATRWIEQIRKMLESEYDDSAGLVWELRKPLTTQQMNLANQILFVVRSIADQYRIPPEVICTRKDANNLARGDRDALLLDGWREEIAGAAVDAVLEN